MDGWYSPTEPSLEGVRLRLDRAEEHLDLLEEAVRAYNGGDFHDVPEEPDHQGEWFSMRIRITRDPEPEWGLIVGDVLHNTRAALDNLVWQLVLANGRRPSSSHQFPIYTRSDKPPRRARLDAMLGGMRPEDQALIEKLQPHVGGHEHAVTQRALTWLVALSNTDKHRYLHPAVAVLDPSVVMQVAVRCTHSIIEHRSTPGLLHDNAEVFAIRTSPDAEVHMEGELPFDVAFGHPQVNAALLDGIHQQVVGIVERFTTAFD